MMQEFLVRSVRACHRRSILAKRALKGREDAEAYVREVRGKILRSFGPFPERTDLKPVITGTLRRDGYRVEKVIFESRPKFLVTANLYVPSADRKPAPGVVGSCGHSTNGKAGGTYQSFAQGLARLGYVVPDLRSASARASGCSTLTPPEVAARARRRRAPARRQPAVPRRRVLRERGAPGTASARSTTC